MLTALKKNFIKIKLISVYWYNNMKKQSKLNPRAYEGFPIIF